MRLLLISSSVVHGYGFLDHPEGAIREVLAGRKRVSFVPFAMADHEGYTEIVRQRLGAMGFDVAKAPESLDAWPASAAIDANPLTQYSSGYFENDTPDRPVFLQGGWSTPRTISKITLSARMVNGSPLAFPAVYDVYVAKPDNSGWDLVAGSLTGQPDRSGHVLIPITPRTTHGVLVIPLKLNTDGTDYYFQLAEMSAEL